MIDQGWTAQKLSGLLGPSFAWGRRPFQAYFGTDEILLEIQALLLREYQKAPWFDYRVPREVVRLARLEWHKRREIP